MRRIFSRFNIANPFYIVHATEKYIWLVKFPIFSKSDILRGLTIISTAAMYMVMSYIFYKLPIELVKNFLEHPKMHMRISGSFPKKLLFSDFFFQNEWVLEKDYKDCVNCLFSQTESVLDVCCCLLCLEIGWIASKLNFRVFFFLRGLRQYENLECAWAGGKGSA